MAHTLVPKKGASCLVSLAVCIELLGDTINGQKDHFNYFFDVDFMPKFLKCKRIKSRHKTTILGTFWTWALRIGMLGWPWVIGPPFARQANSSSHGACWNLGKEYGRSFLSKDFHSVNEHLQWYSIWRPLNHDLARRTVKTACTTTAGHNRGPTHSPAMPT